MNQPATSHTTNHERLPVAPEQGQKPEADLALFRREPARAFQAIQDLLVAAYPNGGKNHFQDDVARHIQRISEEVFGLDQPPRTQGELQAFQRSLNHQPAVPENTPGRKKLLFLLGRIGNIDDRLHSFFDDHKDQSKVPGLKSALFSLYAQLAVETADTTGVLRFLGDEKLSPHVRLYNLTSQTDLRGLVEVESDQSLSEQKRRELNQANRRICATVADIIRADKDPQPKNEVVKDGVTFLLGQGEVGAEFLFYDHNGRTSLIEDPALSREALRVLADRTQHEITRQLKNEKQTADSSAFPLNHSQIVKLIELADFDTSMSPRTHSYQDPATAKEIRREAFRALVSPLFGISHGLSGEAKSVEPEIAQDLEVARRDLARFQQEYGARSGDYLQSSDELVQAKLNLVNGEITDRPPIASLDYHERTERANFDRSLALSLSELASEPISPLARARILYTISRVTNAWVDGAGSRVSQALVENIRPIHSMAGRSIDSLGNSAV